MSISDTCLFILCLLIQHFAWISKSISIIFQSFHCGITFEFYIHRFGFFRAKNIEFMKTIDENEPVFPISVVAFKLGISEHTIRLYEGEGLIIPYKKKSGYRLFSERDMQRIECIKKTINEKKISIAGIRRLLALIPCWEIKGCKTEFKMNCPAYIDFEKPCWLHKKQLKGDYATNDCRECPVYNSIKNCDELKELLKKYIEKMPT